MTPPFFYFMENITRINKWLKLLGTGPDEVSPRYRLIWSTGQTEKRWGEYCDFYGHIFIRRTVGVLEVPKYKFEFQKDKWILEKLIPTNGNPELSLIVTCSYEPVWVFNGDDNNSYENPTLEKVQRIIASINQPLVRLSQSDVDDWERDMDKRDMDRMDEIIDPSPMDGAFISGEAIRVPHKLFPGTCIGKIA